MMSSRGKQYKGKKLMMLNQAVKAAAFYHVRHERQQTAITSHPKFHRSTSRSFLKTLMIAAVFENCNHTHLLLQDDCTQQHAAFNYNI